MAAVGNGENGLRRERRSRGGGATGGERWLLGWGGDRAAAE